jgi:hypothetical protein
MTYALSLCLALDHASYVEDSWLDAGRCSFELNYLPFAFLFPSNHIHIIDTQDGRQQTYRRKQGASQRSGE